MRLDRRLAIKITMAALAAATAGGHTPYGQWTVYRRRNLFIVASRTDEAALALARAVVDGLSTELPESRAKVTRATDPVRIASLLATGQLDVAVVSRSEAAAMLVGSGEFRAVGPVALQTLAELGAYLMVTVDSFKPAHAWLLARSVDHLRLTLPIGETPVEASAPPSPPLHPGAASYYSGAPIDDAAATGSAEPLN